MRSGLALTATTSDQPIGRSAIRPGPGPQDIGQFLAALLP
jgi:hypothetical protein